MEKERKCGRGGPEDVKFTMAQVEVALIRRNKREARKSEDFWMALLG